MKKECRNPQGLAKPSGFTQVIRIQGVRSLVFVGGQLPVDRDGKVVSSSFSVQAKKAFHNLEIALTSVGLTLNNLVKLTIYLVDMSYLNEVKEIRKKFLLQDRPPTITTIAVKSLATDKALLVLDGIAAD